MRTGVAFWMASLFLLGCASSVDPSPGANTLGSDPNESTGEGSTSDAITTSASTAAAGSSSSDGDPTNPTVSTSMATGADGSSTTDPSTTTGAPISWSRYSFNVQDQAWSRVSLEDLWTSPNAPPSSGIAAAVSLTRFDREIVVSEDGGVYEAVNGSWIEPSTLAERFPMAAGLDVGAIYHVPGQGKGADNEEDLYLIDNPTTVYVRILESGATTDAMVLQSEDVRGGPQQASDRTSWILTVSDPALIGKDADWWSVQVAFDDVDRLWRFNAGFEWTDTPLHDNEFFTGSPAEPNPAGVRAAYYDDAFEIAHFIGP